MSPKIIVSIKNLISSFTMALAVHSAETSRRKPLIRFLMLTIILGLIFLGIKFYEYHTKFEEYLVPGSSFRFEAALAAPAEIFFSFYFAMTGMHAVHMIIGIGLLTGLIVKARRDHFSSLYHTPVELTGLYWHFVDIVWIFLFPLLYLLGGTYESRACRSRTSLPPRFRVSSRSHGDHD